MTYKNKWPPAEIALCFVRPVYALSAEIQHRMIARAVKELGICHEIYESPIKGDKEDERGELLRGADRGNEVVIVARLDVLGRTRAELKGRQAGEDFLLFVGNLRIGCKYILVLDDNMKKNEFNAVTSNDAEWEDVVLRALNVVKNGREFTPEKGRKLVKSRWDRKYKGVVQEWKENPERAKDFEAMSRIWRDPLYLNAQAAYDAMPQEVRDQITSLDMARKIFEKRHPRKKAGRPRKNK